MQLCRLEEGVSAGKMDMASCHRPLLEWGTGSKLRKQVFCSPLCFFREVSEDEHPYSVMRLKEEVLHLKHYFFFSSSVVSCSHAKLLWGSPTKKTTNSHFLQNLLHGKGLFLSSTVGCKEVLAIRLPTSHCLSYFRKHMEADAFPDVHSKITSVWIQDLWYQPEAAGSWYFLAVLQQYLMKTQCVLESP